jgi:hypothetical protein
MDNTDPKSLLVYTNRTATAPRYTPNISHKTNVLDDSVLTEEDDEDVTDGPILPRRGNRQSRYGTTRKTRSTSTRTASSRAKWKPVNEETGEIISVTTEQMTNAENLAIQSGLTEDVLIENAGTPAPLSLFNVPARGIAEAVLSSFGSKRVDSKNHNPAPLVVVLAGNNRTGAYSLGAGRWLSLRGIRVLSVLCSNEDDELDVPPSPLGLTGDNSHTITPVQECGRKKRRARRPKSRNINMR